jgi:transglutaminase-like putative cysteine protease
MKKLLLFAAAAGMLWGCGGGEEHFLLDAAYRAQTSRDFAARQSIMQGRAQALLSVFNQQGLTTEQREALEFLYAYMPLCDLADYDGEFFLRQVNASFAARDYFAWGRSVPEDIFRHFVLVYRINNENLDTARMTFMEELKPRLAGLTMYEAALEVNHWCHQKVTYRGTDGRTSAPLALVQTSWGRCGEESTFAACALRAVGIPARQCYTPRWAHTDDNHAWVEVWIEGKWHYLGACEPEAELDRAWFTAPAKRAMMVHTNVFGRYNGAEEKNYDGNLYSKINLLPNYTAVRRAAARVVDGDGRAVQGAEVAFKIYNYAEFYPIAQQQTNAAGMAQITTGMGDLMVWASKDNAWGWAKSTPQDTCVVITIKDRAQDGYSESFTMNVPPEAAVDAVPAEKAAVNAKRLLLEDSIRNGYMATFIMEQAAREYAAEQALDGDKAWKYLSLSQGNWRDIQRLMTMKKHDQRLFPFLESITAKDLRDTRADVLASYLDGSASTDPNVYSPRIERELITPYFNFNVQGIATAAAAAEYVKNNIALSQDNYYNCRMSPRGVFELGHADKASRGIFFTALCRSSGIAARINRVTGRAQYFDGQWKDAAFDADSAARHSKGKLTITNDKDNAVKPSYYGNYTLARYDGGDFRTLDYEGDAMLRNMPCTLDLEQGYYRLTAGSRANDGSVFVHTRYFKVEAGKVQQAAVQLPAVQGKLLVQGIIDMNTIVSMRDGGRRTLKELSNGKGLVLCFVDLGTEPSKHILQDLPAVQKELDAWGGGALLVEQDGRSMAAAAAAFKGLPANAAWALDTDGKLLKDAAAALQLQWSNNYPLLLYLSRNGGILYSAAGYRIGAGTSVLSVIQQEERCSTR